MLRSWRCGPGRREWRQYPRERRHRRRPPSTSAEPEIVPDLIESALAIRRQHRARLAGAEPGVVFDMRAVVDPAPVAAPFQSALHRDLAVAVPVRVLGPTWLTVG